jgi:hypothetical protein
VRSLKRRAFLAGIAVSTASAALAQTKMPAPPPVTPALLSQLAALKAANLASTVLREWTGREELMRYDVDDVQALHYAEVACALGAEKIYNADPTLRLGEWRLADRWERAREVPNSANHVDANIVGLWHILMGDPEGKGIALADLQWSETRADGLTSQARFWIDDIWMIGALQVEAYRMTGAGRFIDRAALMARTYLDRLQKPNGLFHHGPDAPFYWSRGNGWVAAGLTEVLGSLPPDHHEYAAIEAGYRKMIEALLQYQTEDGLWRQLIDREEAWIETSGSAMFGYAMLRGVNQGMLDAETYREPAIRAWNGLQPFLENRTLLREICVGTGQSQDAQYYLDRPRVTGDLHGQAALMWFAAERIKLGRKTS